MATIRFKFEDLSDSNKRFYPYREKMCNALMDYLETKNGWSFNAHFREAPDTIEEVEARGDEYRGYDFLCANWDDFAYAFNSVNRINRVFAKLLDDGEIMVAHILIRVQLDNLTYIYAEMCYPFKVLYKVFEKKRKLNQIKIDGVVLNPLELRKQIDEQFDTNVSELYKQYSGLVHPSKQQIDTAHRVRKFHSWKRDKLTVSKAVQKNYAKDMVQINNLLIKMLREYTSSIKKRINEISNNRK